jgi:hypothetical protein
MMREREQEYEMKKKYNGIMETMNVAWEWKRKRKKK